MCVCVGFVMCVCMCWFPNLWVYMCGFCNVLVCEYVDFIMCVCVDFVMCGCVYVWVLLFV